MTTTHTTPRDHVAEILAQAEAEVRHEIRMLKDLTDLEAHVAYGRAMVAFDEWTALQATRVEVLETTIRSLTRALSRCDARMTAAGLLADLAPTATTGGVAEFDATPRPSRPPMQFSAVVAFDAGDAA